jgi:hypothetical protein
MWIISDSLFFEASSPRNPKEGRPNQFGLSAVSNARDLAPLRAHRLGTPPNAVRRHQYATPNVIGTTAQPCIHTPNKSSFSDLRHSQAPRRPADPAPILSNTRGLHINIQNGNELRQFAIHFSLISIAPQQIPKTNSLSPPSSTMLDTSSPSFG